ncbi:RNA polymerase sigma-70 factor [Mucilaginibacter sp. JRF]|nr:RNA polymerase sigma-70 factor [Mucilaginibacter sp. JRF]
MLKAESIALNINRQTFEQLYEEHWSKVYAICYNNLRDSEAARELVQDIFRSLWERRDELQLTDAGRYLVRAAKLKTFEYIRNKVNQQKHLDIKMQTVNTTVNCTEQQVLYNELKSQVNTLVDTLPPQCKRVYKLSREQGLSNRDIAEQLLISERAVEYHITKALGVLKMSLSAFL